MYLAGYDYLTCAIFRDCKLTEKYFITKVSRYMHLPLALAV